MRREIHREILNKLSASNKRREAMELSVAETLSALKRDFGDPGETENQYLQYVQTISEEKLARAIRIADFYSSVLNLNANGGCGQRTSRI
jgi:hypothetical protein